MKNQLPTDTQIRKIGLVGLWTTGFAALTYLIVSLLYQYSLWTGDWSILSRPEGFTEEQLAHEPVRLAKIIVNAAVFCFNFAALASAMIIFRQIAQQQLFTRKTSRLLFLLGILGILGIFRMEINPIRGAVPAEGVDVAIFSFMVGNFRNVVFGILALAFSKLVLIASHQSRQLDEIV